MTEPKRASELAGPTKASAIRKAPADRRDAATVRAKAMRGLTAPGRKFEQAAKDRDRTRTPLGIASVMASELKPGMELVAGLSGMSGIVKYVGRMGDFIEYQLEGVPGVQVANPDTPFRVST